MKKIIGLGFTLAIAALAFSFISRDKANADSTYKVGDVVEDFSLKNVNGEMMGMASFPEAKGYIVVFTCNTCPYSQMYEERIIDLNNKYAEKGWPVIAINPNDPAAQPGDSFDAMQARSKEYGYTFPYLFDEGQKVYPVWGAERTPHVFIVQRTDDGNILQYIGAIDDNARNVKAVKTNYVANTIKALEANQEPEVTFTKAIGCSIKTK